MIYLTRENKDGLPDEGDEGDLPDDRTEGDLPDEEEDDDLPDEGAEGEADDGKDPSHGAVLALLLPGLAEVAAGHNSNIITSP